MPFLETPALQSGLRACHDDSWQISFLIHQGDVGRSPLWSRRLCACISAFALKSEPALLAEQGPIHGRVRMGPGTASATESHHVIQITVPRTRTCDFSIPEVKRDLDRRGTAMVRDIAIMIAAIAAIVAFAPKVSGRADHPATEAADTACLKQHVETPGCLTPRGD
jgi:hypothetical protein